MASNDTTNDKDNDFGYLSHVSESDSVTSVSDSSSDHSSSDDSSSSSNDSSSDNSSTGNSSTDNTTHDTDTAENKATDDRDTAENKAPDDTDSESQSDRDFWIKTMRLTPPREPWFEARLSFSSIEAAQDFHGTFTSSRNYHSPKEDVPFFDDYFDFKVRRRDGTRGHERFTIYLRGKPQVEGKDVVMLGRAAYEWEWNRIRKIMKKKKTFPDCTIKVD